MLHEALYRAALARGIASFEDHDKAGTRIPHPVLQFEQFDLEQPLDMVVLLTAEALGVGILFPPGINQGPVSLTEYRVVLVRVIHPYARGHDANAARLVRSRATHMGKPVIAHLGSVHGLISGRA